MKIFITVILLLMAAISALGQTPAKIEQELIAAIKEIEKYSTYLSSHDEEKLSAAQDVFEEKLLKYTKIPATLQYKFRALDEHIYIATSEDNRFRIYSWDTQDGGTMHNFSRVYQYADAGGKVHSKTDNIEEEEAGAGGFVTDIFTLDAPAGKVYIVYSTFIGSTQHRGQSLDLYKVEGAKLNDRVKLIKTASGLTHTLNFEYNFFSVIDRKDRPVWLVSFDKRTKTLRIPVVVEDEKFLEGRVTGRFISYRFNGTHFVKVS